jgi:ADP-ribose pyrophosphatase YjhB (NUDIX family)
VLRVGSLLLRPRTRGVKVLVYCEGDLLLVRHSYGEREWDVPGGFARRDEPFADAARRELAEELAIGEVGALTNLGEMRREHMGRHETLGVIRVELAGRGVTLDPFELLRADWFPPGELPLERAEVVDELLAHARGLSGSAGG